MTNAALTGVAASGFGVNGGEIYKPALEQRPRHVLQCRGHLAVEVNLCIEACEKVGNRQLFLPIRSMDRNALQYSCVQIGHD